MNRTNSKTLHERAMEASSVGILIVDMQEPDQPIIYVNPAFEQITGYAGEEVLGRNCRFLQGTERDQPGLEPIRAALREGGEGHALLRNFRKDGTPFWNDLVITPVHGDKAQLTHYIGVMKDVTDRKRAEDALERYEFIVNAVGEMMSVISRDHCYEAVNDQWCETLGQKREAVVGAPVARVWGDPVYAGSIGPLVERCFNEGRPIPFRARIEFPSLGERECDITYYPYYASSGEVTHVVVVTRDVTEQVDTAQALQASESHLRTVLDSVADGIIVMGEDARITSFNPAAERIFGYKAGEVLGRNVSMLMPENYRDQHDGYVNRYLSTRRPRIIGIGQEVEGKRKDGRVFPMDLAVSEMRIGGQHHFVGIVRDISERKRNELELVRALGMAQTASRAKSEFLSSMSHELRTPLNAILGFAQLLEIDPAMGKEQAEDIHEITKAGQHLLELINEVLDLSHIESGALAIAMEPVALEVLARECGSLVESDANRRGIGLHWDIAACDGRHVLADRLRLKQVLLNLLSNAIKYNRPGGKVSVTCASQKRGHVQVSVADTGLGIPEERQAELFTAFQRLGQERSGIEGTGIGLVICKRLMEMMGGGIGMKSRAGHGSTFWIELPEATANLGEAPARTQGEATPPDQEARERDRTHTVLYLEDNAANIKLMQHVLARRKHIRLICCEEPVDGLEQARSLRPDLILLDINLPGMDGYAVLSMLRAWEETRATPIIGISANAMPKDIARAKAAGFNDYLTKPLDIEHLMRTIDRALDQGNTWRKGQPARG